MNSGNSVQDSGLRCAPDVPAQDAEVPAPEEDLQARGSDQPSGSRPPLRHVQDIQEIIDKLAAVTRQLRHPGHS
jgi:hypothetical protein